MNAQLQQSMHATCVMRLPSCDMTPWPDHGPDILVQAYFFIFQVDTCCNYLQNYLEHAFQVVVVNSKKNVSQIVAKVVIFPEKRWNHYFEALLLELIKNWSTLMIYWNPRCSSSINFFPRIRRFTDPTTPGWKQQKILQGRAPVCWKFSVDPVLTIVQSSQLTRPAVPGPRSVRTCSRGAPARCM
jgi:hypothetical protein